MTSICLYFQVHQPLRLRPFSYFQVGRRHDYFDGANRDILRRVVEHCYLPANRLIADLVARHGGRFRVAYSISGTALEQLASHAPEALDSFVALARTGAVEFLAETYYHSLAAIYDEDEFRTQVSLHTAHIEALFGRRPAVFRNTELIYSDRIGAVVEDMGFGAVLAEGADDVLAGRSPNHVYRRPGGELRLLLKNYRLSDDIAFRFAAGGASPALTAGRFVSSLRKAACDPRTPAEVINLFMDYETFGEHIPEGQGIFSFLRELPGTVLARPGWDFVTPGEAVARHAPAGDLGFPRPVSWADEARDLTAWQGNHMQQGALQKVYDLGPQVHRRNNPAVLDLWRKLQTSDHFYYMSTKPHADGHVHAGFSPYPSPYDAFINYMNVMTDLRKAVLGGWVN